MNLTQTANNLQKKGYTVSVFPDAEKAADYICTQVQGKTVAFGGSVTLEQMGLYGKLSARNTVLWHWITSDGKSPDEIRMEARNAEIYFSSVNGLAETGEIVNIDGTGNRLAATLYGHKKVWLIVGQNKIAPDLRSAVDRARNIASPLNAKRLGCKTPCAVKGDKCYDCDSPARICRALEVLWDAPRGSQYEVVLINEDLGY